MPGLGAGALPAAAVSAGALAGFAAGAALGGRWADRAARPARTLALVEVVAAVLSCALLAVLPRWPLPGAFGAVLAALAMAIAATPMGASLPAALRAVGPSRDAVGSCFRRLYAWNTIGAVVGVLASATFLLEALGNRGVVLAAAALEIVAAGIALAIAGGRKPQPPRPAPAPPPATTPGRPSIGRLALAAALAGAAGLAIQVAWFRRLTPALGPTFQVFALVLAVHLASIAVGSLVAGPRRGTGGARAIPWLAALAALPVALLPALVDDVARWVAAAPADAGAAARLARRGLAAAAMLLPSTALAAALLPWLLRAAAPGPEAAGRGAGRLVAANTVGSAVAALAAALAWIPALGTAAVLRGAAGLLLAAGACAAPRRRVALGLGAAAAVVLVGSAAVPLDDAAGRDAMGATYAVPGYDPAEAVPLAFREGSVASVLVRDRDGRREFWVDGSLEATEAPTDRLHLALLADLPMALLRASGRERTRVALVGLGAGFTARGVARWSPSALDVFEIEPAVADAAPLFSSRGGGVPEGARVHLEDGRRGVLRLSGGLDLVTSDPVHPAVAGSAWLYALEHYEGARDQLADDGLFCQWLPLYQVGLEDVRLAVRTFAAAFPHTYVFRAAADGLLVGAKRPLRVSEARLRDALRGAEGRELRALGLGSPGRLLSILVRGPDEARAFAGAGDLNVDDRLLLELRAGRGAYVEPVADNVARLDALRSAPASLLDAPPTAAFLAEVEEGRRHDAALVDAVTGATSRALPVLAARAAADRGDELAAAMLDETTIADAFARLERGDRAGAANRAREVIARQQTVHALVPIQWLDAAEVLARAGEREASVAAASLLAGRADGPRLRRLMGR